MLCALVYPSVCLSVSQWDATCYPYLCCHHPSLLLFLQLFVSVAVHVDCLVGNQACSMLSSQDVV